MGIINIAFAEVYRNPQEIENWFNNQPKCRYKGVIENINDVNTSDCESILSIKGLQLELTQFGFNHQVCDGGGSFGVIYQSSEIFTGAFVSGIMNKDTTSVLYAGKEYFDAYPDIPLCEGQSYTSTFPQILSFSEKIGIGVGSLIFLGIIVFIVKKYFKKPKHKK